MRVQWIIPQMAYQTAFPQQGTMDPHFVRNIISMRDGRIAALEYDLYCARQFLQTQNTDILQLRQRVMELELLVPPFVAAPFRDPPPAPQRPAPIFPPLPVEPEPERGPEIVLAHRAAEAPPVVAPVEAPLPEDDVVEPRRTRTASKQMRDYFLDGDLVRHTIPSLNSEWNGVYDEENEVIRYMGIEYKSISRFSKSHHITALNDPSTMRGANGWKECVIVRNGVETPAHELAARV